jgi:hypothetical protein
LLFNRALNALENLLDHAQLRTMLDLAMLGLGIGMFFAFAAYTALCDVM